MTPVFPSPAVLANLIRRAESSRGNSYEPRDEFRPCKDEMRREEMRSVAKVAARYP